jgi:hypothetical protein
LWQVTSFWRLGKGGAVQAHAQIAHQADTASPRAVALCRSARTLAQGHARELLTWHLLWMMRMGVKEMGRAIASHTLMEWQECHG